MKHFLIALQINGLVATASLATTPANANWFTQEQNSQPEITNYLELREALEQEGVPFPEFFTRVAIVESGWQFNRGVGRYNNLFGMRSRQGFPSTGHGYTVYPDRAASVADLARWIEAHPPKPNEAPELFLRRRGWNPFPGYFAYLGTIRPFQAARKRLHKRLLAAMQLEQETDPVADSAQLANRRWEQLPARYRNALGALAPLARQEALPEIELPVAAETRQQPAEITPAKGVASAAGPLHSPPSSRLPQNVVPREWLRVSPPRRKLRNGRQQVGRKLRQLLPGIRGSATAETVYQTQRA